MQTTFKEAALRAVALLGLLAILLLGAWGIIQLAFFISDLVSNAGGAASNTASPSAHEIITTSIPFDVASGQPVTIGWNHSGGQGNYSYAISYSCVSGLTLKAPVPTGATQAVACDTPFNYTQATSSLTVVPTYAGGADAKVTITVAATNLATGAITAQTSGTLIVHPKGGAVAKPTTGTTKPATSHTAPSTKPAASSGRTPGSTYVPSGRTQNLYGYADLAVWVTSASSRNGNAHVVFTVQNIGTNVSPANWSLIATLPDGYQYPSGAQQALYPGDKIVYTLDFGDHGQGGGAYGYQGYGYNPYNSYSAGGYNPWGCGNQAYGSGCAAGAYYGQQQPVVTIAVDPYNQFPEASKVNNTASAALTY